MKIIVITFFLAIAFNSYAANQSSKDIIYLLESDAMQEILGKSPVTNIANLGRRIYEVSFDSCKVKATLRSNCAGSTCTSEVLLSPANVICL